MSLLIVTSQWMSLAIPLPIVMLHYASLVMEHKSSVHSGNCHKT